MFLMINDANYCSNMMRRIPSCKLVSLTSASKLCGVVIYHDAWSRIAYN